MSIHVMSWVLKHSEEKLGRRLVLLVLADHARDDGSGAYPSIATIARDARLSERQTRYCLRDLELVGAITPQGSSKYGTIVYRVNMGGQNPQTAGGQSTAVDVSQTAPDPSSTRSSSSSTGPKTVDGKQVTAAEQQFATSVLGLFNEATGKRYAGREWVRKIILRHREHPEVSLDEHREIIAAQIKKPWWKGDPTPSVIYGNGATFDRALNGATQEPESKDDPYTRDDLA